MKFSEVTIDEKVYHLGYDFNDIADAEEEAGCNLLAAIENQGNNTAKQLRGLFYAMTRQTRSELTLKDFGKLVRMDTLAPITMAISEACVLAVSDELIEKWRKDVAGAAEEPKVPADEEIATSTAAE